LRTSGSSGVSAADFSCSTAVEGKTVGDSVRNVSSISIGIHTTEGVGSVAILDHSGGRGTQIGGQGINDDGVRVNLGEPEAGIVRNGGKTVVQVSSPVDNGSVNGVLNSVGVVVSRARTSLIAGIEAQSSVSEGVGESKVSACAGGLDGGNSSSWGLASPLVGLSESQSEVVELKLDEHGQLEEHTEFNNVVCDGSQGNKEDSIRNGSFVNTNSHISVQESVAD